MFAFLVPLRLGAHSAGCDVHFGTNTVDGTLVSFVLKKTQDHNCVSSFLDSSLWLRCKDATSFFFFFYLVLGLVAAEQCAISAEKWYCILHLYSMLTATLLFVCVCCFQALLKVRVTLYVCSLLWTLWSFGEARNCFTLWADICNGYSH